MAADKAACLQRWNCLPPKQRPLGLVIEGREQAIDDRANPPPQRKITDRLTKIEPPTRFQDARDLPEQSMPVIHMVDAAEHNDVVEGPRGKRQHRRIPLKEHEISSAIRLLRGIQ